MFGWLRDIVLGFISKIGIALGGYLYGVNKTKKDALEGRLKSVNETLKDKRKVKDKVREMSDEELNEYID